MILFFGLRHRFFVWLYVAGHEITHAIFVLLCRGRVSKVHITSAGGHILTNRNNFLISLSPYFFPFYTAIVLTGWGLAEWLFVDIPAKHLVWLYGAIGFTWMFHFTFTLWMTRRDQPDVEQNGRLFSFALIFLVNILIISALIIVASPTVTFATFGQSLLANGVSFFDRLVESVKEIWGWFQ
ncbi:MAG: hypothetical protein AAF236_13295 [Verrucomicrobiota bacterium]